MKLENLALIAEVAGGVAVVVTLIALLFQIRQSTAAVRASTYQAVVDSITTTLNQRATDKQVATLWHAVATGQQLEGIDAEQLDALLMATTRRFENAFYQHEIGGIDSPQWRGIESAISAVVKAPGYQSRWSTTKGKGSFRKSFQALIDRTIGTD